MGGVEQAVRLYVVREHPHVAVEGALRATMSGHVNGPSNRWWRRARNSSAVTGSGCTNPRVRQSMVMPEMSTRGSYRRLRRSQGPAGAGCGEMSVFEDPAAVDPHVVDPLREFAGGGVGGGVGDLRRVDEDEVGGLPGAYQPPIEQPEPAGRMGREMRRGLRPAPDRPSRGRGGRGTGRTRRRRAGEVAADVEAVGAAGVGGVAQDAADRLLPAGPSSGRALTQPACRLVSMRRRRRRTKS